jgi:hypothetical protein
MSCRSHSLFPLRPVAPWAAVCATLAVSSVLLANEPGRAKDSTTPILQAAKWAGQPSAPVVVSIDPAVADPIPPSGFCVAPRLARPAVAAEIATNRRIARTRWGGRCGP